MSFVVDRTNAQEDRNQSGLPSSCHFSPHMPRSLWTPAGPREHHQRGSFCVGFWLIKTIATCFSLHNGAISRLQGSAASLVAYVVPCVRFSCIVRLKHLLYSCNTRYGWLVRPYPAGTYTLQETPSLLGALTRELSGERCEPPRLFALDHCRLGAPMPRAKLVHCSGCWWHVVPYSSSSNPIKSFRIVVANAL
jgi:hypothetical protein